MNDYPERVTLFDDGIYRWHYDMDMWKNRYILGLISKIIGLLLGIPMLLALINVLVRAMPLISQSLDEERIRFFMRDDLLLLAVVGGMLVGILLLVVIVYAICAAAMHGQWRLRFQMDDTTVSLVRDPGTMKAVNALGAITVVAGIAAGKPGEALRMGATTAAVNTNGATRFNSVRRVKIVEDCDVLDLRGFMSMNQVFVPREDFDAAKAFILERLSEKARDRSI